MQFLMPEGKGDLTYAGIIYERIKESFPEKDAIIGVGFPLPQHQRYFELPKTPPQLSISVLNRFFTSDKSTDFLEYMNAFEFKEKAINFIF